MAQRTGGGRVVGQSLVHEVAPLERRRKKKKAIAMRAGDGLGHGGEGGIALAVEDEAVWLDLHLQDHALVAAA